MTMICSISGVPRMIQTKVLTTADRGLQRLMEPKATTRPSGSANSSVSAKRLTVEQERAGKALKNHRHKNHTYPSVFYDGKTPPKSASQPAPHPRERLPRPGAGGTIVPEGSSGIAQR